MLEELVDDEIIHLASVPKFSGEILFLIGDYVMGRGKPIQILKNPGQHGLPEDLIETYSEKVGNFFENYVHTEEDDLNILSQVFLNPEDFDILKLLRNRDYINHCLRTFERKIWGTRY